MPEITLSKQASSHNHFPAQEWSPSDISLLKDLKAKGHSIFQIGYVMKRTNESVKAKLKEFHRTDIAENNPRIQKKYDFNENFLSDIEPDSILDVYAGKVSFYKSYANSNNIRLVTNDIEYSGHDYKEDATIVLSRLYSQYQTFDLVDLDPCGAVYHSIRDGLRIAKKGIIMTFGEFSMKNYHRFELVGPCYGIHTPEDFTIENMIKVVEMIALQFKKVLIIKYQTKSQLTQRIYFEIQQTEKLNTVDKLKSNKTTGGRGKYSLLNQNRKIVSYFDLRNNVEQTQQMTKAPMELVQRCWDLYIQRLKVTDIQSNLPTFQVTRQPSFVDLYIRKKNK